MRGETLTRIIGIDPGLRRTGWGVIETDGVRLSYVSSGLITSKSDEDLAYRLRELYEGLTSVISGSGAREAAVEETFVNENAPYFFVPRYIEFVDELPHTPSGRVRKFQLRSRGVTDATWDREAAGFKLKR